jgi:hypothetical protein
MKSRCPFYGLKLIHVDARAAIQVIGARIFLDTGQTANEGLVARRDSLSHRGDAAVDFFTYDNHKLAPFLIGRFIKSGKTPKLR